MTDEEFAELKKLSYVYNQAISVCDPVEFIVRQQALLYSVCKFLLIPCYEEQKRRAKVEEE